MRLLHAGHRHDHARPGSNEHPEPTEARDSRRPVRQSLPLHRLPEHRCGGAEGGGAERRGERRTWAIEIPAASARPLLRKEDYPAPHRHRAAIVDDIAVPGAPARALRPLAARPRPHPSRSTADGARATPGVVAVVTGRDVLQMDDARCAWRRRSRDSNRPKFTTLPIDKVRFQGDPVVCVVATDRYLAEDAAELIEIDYEVAAGGGQLRRRRSRRRSAGRREPVDQPGLASELQNRRGPARRLPRRSTRSSKPPSRSVGRPTCRSRREAVSRSGTAAGSI